MRLLRPLRCADDDHDDENGAPCLRDKTGRLDFHGTRRTEPRRSFSYRTLRHGRVTIGGGPSVATALRGIDLLHDENGETMMVTRS